MRPRGAAYDKMVSMALHLASTDAANELLERDPLALLLGMQLDQQIPMEKAFTSPSVLAERMGVPPGGRLDAAAIAALPPETLLEHFRTPPALHRFPGSMATRTQQLCQALVDDWGGDAANVWSGVDSGAELVRRIGSLPGFGDQKAKIFAALLAKQFGVDPGRAGSRPPATTASQGTARSPTSSTTHRGSRSASSRRPRRRRPRRLQRPEPDGS